MLSIGCSNSNPAGPSVNVNPGDAVTLAGGSTLAFQDSGFLDTHRDAIERITEETVIQVRALIPIDGVTISAKAGTANVIPEIGFGGRAESGTTVHVTFNQNSPNLASSLEIELFPLLAHELHHIARQRTVGYGDDLLGAMISEGLADQFAIEIAGIDPPRWSRALDSTQLTTFSARAREEWFSTAYSHNRWFSGPAQLFRAGLATPSDSK